MTDGSLKASRHYPVISIDVRAIRASAGERPFDLRDALIGALRWESGGSESGGSASGGSESGAKPLKLRAWAREVALPEGARTFVYLVTPRGGGGVASSLLAALERLWPGGHARSEGSLAPTGEEALLFQVDGSVAHRAPPIE